MSQTDANPWSRYALPGAIGLFPLLLALIFLPWLDAPFSAPKTAVLIVGAALLFAAVLMKCEHVFALPRAPLTAAGAFLAIVLVSAAFSPYRRMAAAGVVWAASGVLLFVAASAPVGHTRRWLAAIALAGGAVAALTLLQFFLALDLFRWFGVSSSNTGRMRLYATIGNPDFVAAFLAACIPAWLALAIKGGARRWACMVGIVASVAAVVATGSRVGLCATGVALAATLVLVSTSRVRRLLALGLLVVAAFSAVLLPSSNHRNVDEALRGRVFVWRVSLRGVADHVLLGDGPNTFAYLYPTRLGEFFRTPQNAALVRFAGNERHAENDFLEIFMETGSLGLAAFVALLGTWVASVWRVRAARPAASAALGAVAALAVAALGDFPLHRAEAWALLWLWMAIPFVAADTDAPARSRACKMPRAALAVMVVLAGVLLAARPVGASYWSARGRQLESAAELDAATTAYKRALRWDSAWADARFNLARVLAKRSRFDESWRASEAALAFVNEPECWLLRARIQQVRGNAAFALFELQHGLALFPHSAELQAEFAELQPGPHSY